MKRLSRRVPVVAVPLLLLLLLLPFVGGCDDHDDHPTATTQILSSYYDDGNIVRYGDGSYDHFFPPPSDDNIWVGLYGADEWRGFLQFPLGGSGGVPAGVGIRRATLDLVVRSVQPGMRLYVDLVDVDTSLGAYGAANPEALWNDGMVLPLATVAVDHPYMSSPRHVPVELRLLLDPGASAGLMIFTDPWADTQVAPLLEVEYYL
jgi:hypothetical protein